MWLRSRNGGAAAGGAGGDDVSVLQAQRCELCREKLVFRAKYREGAPTQLRFSEVSDVCSPLLSPITWSCCRNK